MMRYRKISSAVMSALAMTLSAGAWADDHTSDDDTPPAVAATEDAPREFDALLVTTKRLLTEDSGSYAPGQITAGSKLAMDWKDVPRSVSTLTRQQLDDQGLLDFERAMDQMPGITLDLPSWGIGAAGFYSRGYQITNISIDGGAAASTADPYLNVQPALEFYDSVQLLRGPDALFSGNGAPSGSINLLRKRPTDTFVQRYTLSAGSWDNYKAIVDIGGPLSPGGALRGRAVAAQHETRAFWANSDRQNTSVYALFELDLGTDTLLTFGGNRSLSRGQGYDAAPALPRHSNGEAIDLPRSLGLPADVFMDSENKEVFVGLEQRLSHRWSARLNASRNTATSDLPLVAYWGGSDALTNSGSDLYRWCCFDYDHKASTIDLNVQGAFDLFGREHLLVVGADRRNTRGGDTAWFDVDPREYYPIGAWDAWDPSRLALGLEHTDDVFWWRRQVDREYGLYANTRLQLGDRLRAFLGGRYSRYRGQWAEVFFAAGGALNESRRNDDIFLPYYGLTYALTPDWSAYGSLSYSSEDQSNNYTPTREPLTTVASGRNLELGLKGALSGLNVAIALYRMERDDVAVQIGSLPGFNMPGRNCCYAPLGEFRSQGAEIELAGNVRPGWMVSGGFTFDDNTTEHGTATGERLVTFAPRRQLKLWTRYELPWADPRFAVGGGVRAQSDQFRAGSAATWNPAGGDLGTGGWDGPSVPYRFRAAGRAVWDLFASWQVNDAAQLQLNLNNVFDKRYWQRVDSPTTGNTWGEPFNGLLTLRVEI